MAHKMAVGRGRYVAVGLLHCEFETLKKFNQKQRFGELSGKSQMPPPMTPCSTLKFPRFTYHIVLQKPESKYRMRSIFVRCWIVDARSDGRRHKADVNLIGSPESGLVNHADVKRDAKNTIFVKGERWK